MNLRGAAALLGAALGLLCTAPAGQATLSPGRLAVLDAFADPFALGHFGAIFSADPLAAPGDAATPLSSSAELYQASGLAFRGDGSLLLVDRDADPSGAGVDPNGDPGPGAVFRAEPVAHVISVLADGTNYLAGLPPATPSIFVDPRGIAVASDGVTAFVADTDADPSSLGPDSAGFAGHGALFSVDAAGAVRLVSDGTISDDGPPPRGAPSWLEDPGATCVASDGSVYVLDIFGDPLATGGRGAVFRVDVATGRLRLVAASADFVGPAGLAELSPGRLIVTDQLANLRGDGSRGALFAVDLAQPDPLLATSVLATDPRFRGPSGIDVARDGSAFIADAFADPLGLARIGAVFRLRPSGEISVASAAAQYLAATSVRVTPPVAPPPMLVSVSPDRGEAGQSLTVTLTGSGFDPIIEARFGESIVVTATRFIAPDRAEADLFVQPAALPGLRDVELVNSDLQSSRLPASFEVTLPAGPAPSSVDPPAGVQGTRVNVTIRGDRFENGATLDLGSGVIAAPVTWISATELSATLDVDALATPGSRDLTVTNPGGIAGSLASAFTVLEPTPPLPSALSPASMLPGRHLDVIVDGSGFVPGMELGLGAGLIVGPVIVDSAFRARARVFVRADAAPGFRDAVVTNPDLRSGSLAMATRVEDAPALRLVALLVDDSAGNDSGWIDPGEPVALDVLAWSSGPRALRGAVLRVSTPPGSGGSMTRDSVVLGASGPGLLRRPAAPFPEMSADAGLACGTEIPVRVEILEGSLTLLDTVVRLAVGEPGASVRKPAIAGSVSGARAGSAVALGDVDGDGLADLIAGAPRDSPGGVFASGRVSAVSSATDDPLWTLDGSVIDERFGSALAVVGDINGDGAEDLIVGAPGAAAGAGRVLLVDGATSAILASATGAPGEGIGSSVAWLGDRDLDGLGDILVGAPQANGSAGRVFVMSLPDLAIRDSLDGAPGDQLGTALSRAGDLDGDGREDAALGAPGSGAGRLLLWSGDGSLVIVNGAVAGDRFGASLAGGSDADLDAVPDLVVGAPGASSGSLASAGRIEWLSGASLARRILPGSEALAEMGSAVAFIGDRDGDGRTDVAVGSPAAWGGLGSVEIRSSAGLQVLHHEPGTGRPGDRFGEALAGDRRAAGDGHVDLAIGAPRQGPDTPLSGRAVLLRSLPLCQSYQPCLDDAWEPNGPGSPASVTHGIHAPLGICPGDVDAFRIDLAAASRARVVVSFTHALGDLDAALLDDTGAIVEQSLSVDDDEELGPFGPGGSWEIRVAGYAGARNTYALHVIDPDTCVPVAEIQGLRVAKAGSASRLTWLASADTCHAAPPGPSYRIWQATTAAGTPGLPFPAGTGFVDVTALDLDGNLADEAHVSSSPGPAYWLVADIGRTGDGPSGWSPSR